MTRHVNLFHMLNVLRCRVEWGQKFKNDTRCACSSFVQRIILLQGKEEHVKCSVGGKVGQIHNNDSTCQLHSYVECVAL